MGHTTRDQDATATEYNKSLEHAAWVGEDLGPYLSQAAATHASPAAVLQVAFAKLATRLGMQCAERLNRHAHRAANPVECNTRLTSIYQHLHSPGAEAPEAAALTKLREQLKAAALLLPPPPERPPEALPSRQRRSARLLGQQPAESRADEPVEAEEEEAIPEEASKEESSQPHSSKIVDARVMITARGQRDGKPVALSLSSRCAPSPPRWRRSRH